MKNLFVSILFLPLVCFGAYPSFQDITNFGFTTTNYANAAAAAAASKAASASTNYANTIGANATNYANTIFQNSTNFTLLTAAANTNYTFQVATNGTNYANSLAAANTNFTTASIAAAKVPLATNVVSGISITNLTAVGNITNGLFIFTSASTTAALQTPDIAHVWIAAVTNNANATSVTNGLSQGGIFVSGFTNNSFSGWRPLIFK